MTTTDDTTKTKGSPNVERGSPVIVKTEETHWPACFIVSFMKMNGSVRFVVEDQYGRVFIQNPKQVAFTDDQATVR